MLYELKGVGETMNQFVKRIKDKHNITKIAFTARLDPMAKGIVPFVVGDNCSKIMEHLGTTKTYQVKVILGIQTDSDDPLGIISSKLNITNDNYKIIIKSIIDYLTLINNTTFNQKYHHFSTKMLNHRRQKSTDVIDNHTVSLYNFKVLKEGIFDYGLWKNKIIGKINLIDNKKNFRQEETIKQWDDILDIKELSYIKLELSVSSGFFIRQLTRDMSNNINIPLMCYNINRVSVE